MTVYKESMVNKIEDDLQGRNQNWDTLETHLAESLNKHINESGSNVNGSYIRFDDGTQICTLTSPVNTDTTAFRNICNNEAYPASFVGSVYKIPGGLNRLDGGHIEPFSWPYDLDPDSLSHSGRIRAIVTSGLSMQLQARLLVVGRWK